jgi:hypothetical protein
MSEVVRRRVEVVADGVQLETGTSCNTYSPKDSFRSQVTESMAAGRVSTSFSLFLTKSTFTHCYSMALKNAGPHKPLQEYWLGGTDPWQLSW